MYYNNFLKVMILIIVLTGSAACNSALKDETKTATGHDQIKNYWTLENTAISDNSVLLDSDGATVSSKFTARNFDLNMKVKTTSGAEGSLVFHAAKADGSSPKGYSVFINNSEYRSGSTEKTGSLSLIRNFYVRMVEDDEWFDLGRLEYCIGVIREVGLSPEDMWFPRPAGEKKVSSMGLPEEITG